MKGTIFENGEQYYTHIAKIFLAIENVRKNYNWLITDCSCYPQSIQTSELLSKGYCWLSGDELSELVDREDFQWTWAVLMKNKGTKKGLQLPIKSLQVQLEVECVNLQI